ncbi:MAG: nucleoside-diphosphate kinase [Candidatus Methanomethylicota archaeon]|uniref:Nucleoside diphosphate kinase n=1 Tax=Thermoproteota archaeon TaxID=2056631 RepID=A0A497EW64_9CREN|nr:MAG: nucleoside-diphosphate kinase [Candidatus Verstraetearchaeota archaeon]
MGSNIERTLIIIKPDGVVRGLIGEILSRFEKRGLKIVGLKMKWLSREEAERLYAVHKGKHFFEDLINYVTSSPVVAAVIEGKNAISIVRRIIGATNAAEALPGTIRGDFALDINRNVIHAADSPENAVRELSIIFNSDEIYSYERVDEKWL